jgi:activator-of-BECN1-regulated-autophagy protein 1
MDISPPVDGEVLKIDPSRPTTESMRRHPKLGQLLTAAPLDGTKSSGVTCVKLSPSAEYCLLGYGVRENIPSVDGRENRHPVTSLYNVNKGMQHVCTLTSADDDVNIARFHPESGHGFVYGTKQGRVRILSTRPWNHYHL